MFVPKGRRNVLYGKVRRFLGPVFHELASQKRCSILEGHLVQDPVHMLIAILPKYAVSTVGFEEEQIKRYIQNQEQLAGEGSDEEDDF